MPISRTLMLPDARATRSVSPSVHDTTRPFAGADHACGIANVTIAATNITNLIAHPTALNTCRSPAQHTSKCPNAVLAQGDLLLRVQHQRVRVSRPHHDAAHVQEVNQIASVRPKEPVRCQPVLQSIKRLGHFEFPRTGHNNCGIPRAGAVPDIIDWHEAHFILLANGQHRGGALVHGAGRIGADARHRGGHLNPTAFLRAAHAAILRRGPILNCAGQTRQVTQVSYHEKGNQSEQQTTLGIFIVPIPLRLRTQRARLDARRA